MNTGCTVACVCRLELLIEDSSFRPYLLFNERFRFLVEFGSGKEK